MNNGISVIIPVYNRELFIKEAIQSVLSQDYEGIIEVVISDDGSTDRSLIMAESFGEKVKILRKPNNCLTQGVSSTRNRGLKEATQPLISFLDSDDFYLPGHLKKICKVFENASDFGFAFCRILEVKELEKEQVYKPWTHKKIFKSDVKNPVVSRSKIVHTNSFVFRREVFDLAGIFNEKYPNGEDGDLWMRISEQFKGKFCNYYGAVYRIEHGTGQLTNNSSDSINSCNTEIFKNAVVRFHKLGLMDSYRMFELKHQILHNEFGSKGYVYYIRYLNLIRQYPLDFLRRIRIGCYEILEKKESMRWKDLRHFSEKI